MGGIYLYGIIEGTNEANLGFAGVDGASPVHIVARDGLGGVVSDYNGEEFRGLSKEKLVRCLLAHQRVVEQVMQQCTVLPAKFGTLLNNPQEALDLLSQGHSQLGDALAAIQGKVEVEVAATWDSRRVLQEISQEAEIVQAREAIAHKGPPTVEDRLQLGQMVKGYLDKRREGYRERMVSYLQPLAVAVAPNALVSDELVMNVAFLVDRARQPEFDEAVQRLDQLFQNEITFRVIGPLPPYSFKTVDIARLTPQQVEEAKQTLHLGDALSEAEVRQAYRRLAAQEQRQFRPGDRLAQDQFARLRQASELLLGYCRARDQAWRDRGRPTPADLDTSGLFVIAIKAPRSDEVEPARFGGAVPV